MAAVQRKQLTYFSSFRPPLHILYARFFFFYWVINNVWVDIRRAVVSIDWKTISLIKKVPPQPPVFVITKSPAGTANELGGHETCKKEKNGRTHLYKDLVISNRCNPTGLSGKKRSAGTSLQPCAWNTISKHLMQLMRSLFLVLVQVKRVKKKRCVFVRGENKAEKNVGKNNKQTSLTLVTSLTKQWVLFF